MPGSDEVFYVITVSRLMIGGRVFSKGDVVVLSELGLMRYAVRSGAMVPLPRGVSAQVTSGEMLTIEPNDGLISGRLTRPSGLSLLRQ